MFVDAVPIGSSSTSNTDEPESVRQVVRSHRNAHVWQYSIYPANRTPPAPWEPGGFTGTLDECWNWIIDSGGWYRYDGPPPEGCEGAPPEACRCKAGGCIS